MWLSSSLIILATFADTPTVTTLPPGNGKEIVQRACIGCHALKVVTSKKASPEQWTALVNQMISRGAEVDDDDVETVVNYLSKNFPADGKTSEAETHDSHSQTVNVNQASAAELTSELGFSADEASAIVACHKQHGNFKTLDDLAKVPGIDMKKIESNKERIRFQ
jgi:competence protein ComEA